MNDLTPDESHAWEETTNPTIPVATGVPQPKKSAFPVVPVVLGALALGIAIGLATAASNVPPTRRKRYERSLRDASKAVRKAIEPRRQEFLDQIAHVRTCAESALNQLPSLPKSRKNSAVEQAVAKLQALAPWN